MSVLERMKEMLPELSKNERKVAEYFLQYPYDARRFSCEAVALSCKTSRSAVIRLCQKLGFKGYSEFKYTLSKESLTPQAALQEKSAESGDSVLVYYKECMGQMEGIEQSERLLGIADTILYANRVLVLGYMHSGLSARQMAFRLNRLNIDSHAVEDSSVMDNYTRILKQGDAVMIFSISGMEQYIDIANAYRQNRAKVILITMTPESPLIKAVDEVIMLPYISHSGSPYLLDDTITFFLFIEMLINVLNKKISQREA